MDSTYKKEVLSIDAQASSFAKYIEDFLLDEESRKLLWIISQQTKIYVFSGIIRNFLTGYLLNRDLDIVIQDINKIHLPFKAWRKLSITKNSFGGYKITYKNLRIDAWSITQTWGITRRRIVPTPEALIKTAFFNFSAIVFDYNEKKYIYDTPFLEFYKTKAMDVVFWRNPNPALCILNTIHYAIQYDYPIKYNLCVWLTNHYHSDMDFDGVSIRHFGCVMYGKKLIHEIILYIKKNLIKLSCDSMHSAVFLNKGNLCNNH